MAGRMKFSDLIDDDESDEGVLESALREDAEMVMVSYPKQKDKKANVFDWSQEDEELENQKMESFSSNLMGVKTSDIQDAQAFLRKSKLDFSDGKQSNEISGEAWGGEKYSLKDQAQKDTGKLPVSSARVRSGSSETRTHGSFSSDKGNAQRIPANQVRGTLAAGTDKTKQTSYSKDESLSDIVKDKPQISAREYNNLKAELRKCKTTIAGMKNDRWTSIPPQEAIKRIILGKPYSLEYYKSLKQKMELLDFALKYHDGNAIMAVILFLRRTLKPSIFALQLKRQPEAINHFTRYLGANSEWKTLLDFYLQLNRAEDVAMLRYHYVTKLDNPTVKLREIEKWQRENKHAEVTEMKSHVEEERLLLEKQIKMEAEDQIMEKQGKNVLMRYHPRTTTIPLKSLLTTLYYCAMYHFGEKPTDPYHPAALKTAFKLTDKQYEWTVLPARAKLHKWADVTEILTATGWLKRKSERSYIGFDKVTQILQKFGAPTDILEKYIRLIENAESRLKAATLCKCHETAIDTIVAMRDRHKLEEYREHVKFDAKYRQKIFNLLEEGSHVKWR
eukprot:Seg2706.1 transcript_id=Seg2706.1/GoldUCD/mRNA.D3Y31 product="Spermatogenesis-defective protein 39" protein_id=Seg2706.1/GoldUCD/D3Y31